MSTEREYRSVNPMHEERYVHLATAVLKQAHKDYKSPWGTKWGDHGQPDSVVIRKRRGEIIEFCLSQRYTFYRDIVGLGIDGCDFFDCYIKRIGKEKAR